ncbi:hypothetical protein U1Q18_000359 [Sarracenia purpurea var. burkii]
MAPSDFSLLLFLLLILSSNLPHIHVQSTEEGFVSIEIFNKGLNFSKDLLIRTAISSLTPLELPKIEKPVKIPFIGTVHITFSNMVLYRVDVSSSTVKSGDRGIAIVASGANGYMNMDWSYHYNTWLIPDISDKGIAYVEVEGMEVGLTLGLKNQQGILELSLLECGCHVKNISIKLDGGASWLYQGLVDAFGKKISSAVEDTISHKIEDGIKKLDSILQSLPKEVAVDEIAALNVTFVNDLVFSNSSTSLEIDGLFTAMHEVVAFDHYARNSRASVSFEGPAKMVAISIHEKVLNSAALVYFNADVMHWIVDKIPNQSLLNTTEWRLVIPQLYKQYPDDDMRLNISITSPPIIRVAQQNIDATIYSDVTIDVLAAGEVIPVACVSLVVSLSGYPEISRNNLTGNVKLKNFTMFLKWSKVGNLHMNLLEPVIQTVVRTVLVPYANLVLWRGFPLPDFKGYRLHNAQIRYVDSRVIVCSDVASSAQGNLNPFMV